MLIKVGCGGVDLSSLHPKCWEMIKWFSTVFHDEEVVITSTWEGTHINESMHYRKRALDFRMPRGFNLHRLEALRKYLGKDFDIFPEKDHIHIEWDPKT